ncbi:DsbA family protein [Candidatus Woesearchaeota archaeon]|nr:DsbA family protein [Candidatus Woesearchaeota archaeon]
MEDTQIDEHKENVRRNRTMKSSLWKWSTLVLFLLLVVTVYMNGFPRFGSSGAVDRAVSFVNEELLADVAVAELVSSSMENGFYKIELKLVPLDARLGEPKNATIYVSKDGNILFPTAVDISTFSSSSATTSTGQVSNTSTSTSAAVNNAGNVIGNPNASLSIIEFGDYQCPACGAAHPTITTLLADYDGKVNLIFKNYPITSKHEFAQKASEAAECAGVQGEFEAYYNTLYENQLALTIDDLKKYASDLGLDRSAFDNCLDSGAMAEKVAADQLEGINAGVSGTPTFFIGEQKIIGPEKLETFKAAIDAELAKLSPEIVVNATA